MLYREKDARWPTVRYDAGRDWAFTDVPFLLSDAAGFVSANPELLRHLGSGKFQLIHRRERKDPGAAKPQPNVQR